MNLLKDCSIVVKNIHHLYKRNACERIGLTTKGKPISVGIVSRTCKHLKFLQKGYKRIKNKLSIANIFYLCTYIKSFINSWDFYEEGFSFFTVI